MILVAYGKLARINKLLALVVCFTQPCSSAGRILPRLDHACITTGALIHFHKNEFDKTYAL